jgi:hypothetical protein
MESAVFGLLGVIVGGFITTALAAYWQRKNWHLQELLKAYAALFEAGFREVQICQSILGSGAVGEKALVERGEKMLGATIESQFLQAISQCRLLEPDSSLRNRLDDLDRDYRSCRDGVLASADLEGRSFQGQTQARTDAQINRLEREVEKYAKPKDVKKHLLELREVIGSRYFWRKARTPPPSQQIVSALFVLCVLCG